MWPVGTFDARREWKTACYGDYARGREGGFTLVSVYGKIEEKTRRISQKSIRKQNRSRKNRVKMA